MKTLTAREGPKRGSILGVVKVVTHSGRKPVGQAGSG